MNRKIFQTTLFGLTQFSSTIKTIKIYMKNMKKQARSIKLIICLGMAAFFITGLVRGSFESATGKDARFLYPEVRIARNNTLRDLDRIQLLESIPSATLA